MFASVYWRDLKLPSTRDGEFCAAGLQVLWAEERARKGLAGRQTFVDLGCGNGLLVHILTNEGVSLAPPRPD